MDEKARIYEIADRMVLADRVPTNEAVRDEMGGGSFATIQPILKEWRKDRRYHACLATLDLSEEFARTLAKVAKTMNQALGGQREKASAAPHRTAPQEATADQELLASLQAENQVLKAEVEQLRAATRFTTAGRPELLKGERFRGVYASTQRAFWDGFMEELHDLLRGGRKTADELMDLIHPHTLAMVQMLGNPPLTKGELVEKMRKRVGEGYYFHELKTEPETFEWVARTRAHPEREGSEEFEAARKLKAEAHKAKRVDPGVAAPGLAAKAA